MLVRKSFSPLLRSCPTLGIRPLLPPTCHDKARCAPQFSTAVGACAAEHHTTTPPRRSPRTWSLEVGLGAMEHGPWMEVLRPQFQGLQPSVSDSSLLVRVAYTPPPPPPTHTHTHITLCLSLSHTCALTLSRAPITLRLPRISAICWPLSSLSRFVRCRTLALCSIPPARRALCRCVR